MKSALFAAIVAALMIAAVAAASTATDPWSKTDMVAAVKALGYPKPHPKSVTCRRAGPGFRCVAIYRTKRVFYTEGQARGGWICAGAKLATCKTLRHGFVSTGQVAKNGSAQFSAELAAEGYMALFRGQGVTYTAPNCVQPTRPSTWSFCYVWQNNTSLNVTVHMGQARGGYVTTVTAATY